MADSPPVTVIIPTRGRLPLLKEALDSVMAQTLGSFEAVVVDDASEDGTSDWLAGQSDEQVTAIVFEEHVGRAAACNRGLEQAQGAMVLFLDDDDRLRVSALELLYSALTGRPEAVGAIGARMLFNERGQRRRVPHPRHHLTRVVWPDLLAGWMTPPGTVLWRTENIRAVGGWNEEIMVGGMGGDRELWLRAARGRSMVCIPDIVLEKRTHSGQWRAREARQIHEQWMRELIDSWPPEDSALAVRLIKVNRMLNDARIAYGNLESRKALSLYWQAFRLAPSVLRSPLLGPGVALGTVKSLTGAITGRMGIVAARRLKRAVQRARGRDVEEIKTRKSLRNHGL